MVTYIKKNVPGFITMESELNPENYNNVGTTYNHYLNGWWVLINEEQLSFKENNPEASIEEIINMTLKEKPAVDMLAKAKNLMIGKIKDYDRSENVNNFIINDAINAWFNAQERNNYKQSIEAAKLLGELTLDFLVNGMVLSVSVQNAEYMLAQIQRYADKCFIVTEQHKMKVNKLTTVEEVENYDFTKGYPEMLKFDLV
jgi:hypothetical protein